VLKWLALHVLVNVQVTTAILVLFVKLETFLGRAACLTCSIVSHLRLNLLLLTIRDISFCVSFSLVLLLRCHRQISQTECAKLFSARRYVFLELHGCPSACDTWTCVAVTSEFVLRFELQLLSLVAPVIYVITGLLPILSITLFTLFPLVSGLLIPIVFIVIVFIRFAALGVLMTGPSVSRWLISFSFLSRTNRRVLACVMANVPGSPTNNAAPCQVEMCFAAKPLPT